MKPVAHLRFGIILSHESEHKQLTQRFLLEPRITFLNHGSFGATPRRVFECYQRWQRELEYEPVGFLIRRAPELLQASRAFLAEYLGTQANNLVYAQNATIGLNIVARSLNLVAGDEVLSPTMNMVRLTVPGSSSHKNEDSSISTILYHHQFRPSMSL